jgi:hypothetical protein
MFDTKYLLDLTDLLKRFYYFGTELNAIFK